MKKKVELNPDVKQRWIEALRSGKYEQGQGRLRDGDRYCCLGVLCEIEGLVYDGEVYYWEGKGTDALVPYGFGRNINLDTDIEEQLAKMNDSGKPFSEIADFIEENL